MNPAGTYETKEDARYIDFTRTVLHHAQAAKLDLEHWSFGEDREGNQWTEWRLCFKAYDNLKDIAAALHEAARAFEKK